MARRETESFRTVTDPVVKQQDQVTSTLLHIGKSIIETSQQAKIAENFSKVQLELNQLDMQYQVDFEDDPFGGLDDLKQSRQDIFDKYGEEISPIYRRNWNDSVRDLSLKNDATTEAWGYKQTRVNTKTSINTSIKNNMNQAAIDGQNFGNQDTDELGSMLNYAESKGQLVEFGDKYLGAATTTELLESYDDNYLKSFISGVAETNTLKALRLMDDDRVKNSFRDQAQYSKMKDAIETRSLNIGKINSQKEVLDILKNENNILTKSFEQPLSYTDLQLAFDATPNMSNSAKSFFLKANGFKNQGKKISASDQLNGKAELYSDMTNLMTKQDLSSKEVAKFQERIYKNMDNGTLTEKEGISYINELVAPLIIQKEENFSKFSQDSWISPDVGFGGVQEMFDDQVAITPAEGETEVGAVSQGINNANQVKLYDYYMTALQEEAVAYGVENIGAIGRLNKPQQRKLYANAQARAFNLFKVDQNPSLSTLNDLPNQTFSNGKLIQGASGSRDLKPDVSVKPTFESFLGSDGFIYRKYPNGKYERAGKAPKGQK